VPSGRKWISGDRHEIEGHCGFRRRHGSILRCRQQRAEANDEQQDQQTDNHTLLGLSTPKEAVRKQRGNWHLGNRNATLKYYRCSKVEVIHIVSFSNHHRFLGMHKMPPFARS